MDTYSLRTRSQVRSRVQDRQTDTQTTDQAEDRIANVVPGHSPVVPTLPGFDSGMSALPLLVASRQVNMTRLWTRLWI